MLVVFSVATVVHLADDSFLRSFLSCQRYSSFLLRISSLFDGVLVDDSFLRSYHLGVSYLVFLLRICGGVR